VALPGLVHRGGKHGVFPSPFADSGEADIDVLTGPGEIAGKIDKLQKAGHIDRGLLDLRADQIRPTVGELELVPGEQLHDRRNGIP